MKKSISKIVTLLTVFGFIQAGILGIGNTNAYFIDEEVSQGNNYSAGILDLSLRSSQGNFVSNAENMQPGDQVNRDIYIGKIASSLALKHDVSFEFISGDAGLCDQLDLKIWYDHYHGPVSGGYDNRDMRLKYDGPLTSLVDLIDEDFIISHLDDQFDTDPNDGTEQWFYYSIVLPGTIADIYQGQVCNFNFVVEAWQDNIGNYGDGGFTDVEKLENTIKVGYWNPPVVLNEFLPNAENYPEFIEVYNNTSSPIDLNGFYIKANGNIIPINAITTNAYSGGITTIPANGWLVVTKGGDLINNNSGTIALYNGNDVVVDSYTYGSPDHNVNNTPGWTNNLVAYWPFDNDILDKSGNGNNGTNYGATFVPGKINQSLNFDGINNYVEVADSTSLDITNQITVEGWIKLNSFSQRSTIAGRWRDINDINERGYLLTVSTDGSPMFYISTTGANYPKAGASPLSTGQWYHLIGTYDGVNIKLYVNGVLSATTPQVGNIYLNNESLLIGANDGWGGTTRKFTNGLIDEVKIYNRALSSQEILEHYGDVSIPSGSVPVDKSYARIPDGSPNWVDPIPTPGAPNKLDEEKLDEEEIEELEPEPKPEPEPEIIPELQLEEVIEEIPLITATTTTSTIPDIDILENSTSTSTTIPEEIIPEQTTATTTEPLVAGAATSTTTMITTEPPVEELDLTTATTTESLIEETTITTTTMPEEPTTTTTESLAEESFVEEIVVDETTVEELTNKEQIVVETDNSPAIEEQPIIVPDNNPSDPDGAGESVNDDNVSPVEGIGENFGDSGVDTGGESVSE